MPLTDVNQAEALRNAAEAAMRAHGFEPEFSPAVIRERLGAFLPKYMLPTVFYRMEQLPRNPNGKIDRHNLLGRVA